MLRRRGISAALAGVVMAAAGWVTAPSPAAAPSQGGQVCTWGGTPAAPTGRVYFSAGLTNTPSTGPIHGTATGALSGSPGCTGTSTFEGEFAPGATCNAFRVAGTVAGLPGVARFEGGGGVVSVDVLYDGDGNVVGSDQPQVLTPDNAAHATDCNTPDGFRAGTFSSTIELSGAGR